MPTFSKKRTVINILYICLISVLDSKLTTSRPVDFVDLQSPFFTKGKRFRTWFTWILISSSLRTAWNRLGLIRTCEVLRVRLLYVSSVKSSTRTIDDPVQWCRVEGSKGGEGIVTLSKVLYRFLIESYSENSVLQSVAMIKIGRYIVIRVPLWIAETVAMG